MCIDCEYCGKPIYFSERFLHFGKEMEIECNVCLRNNKFILNIDRTTNIKPQEKVYMRVNLKEPMDNYYFMEILLGDMKVIQKDWKGNTTKKVKIKNLDIVEKTKMEEENLFFIINTYKNGVYKNRVLSNTYGKVADKLFEMDYYKCDYHNRDFGQEMGIKVFYISHMELLSVHINEHKDTIYLTFEDVKEEIND